MTMDKKPRAHRPETLAKAIHMATADLNAAITAAEASGLECRIETTGNTVFIAVTQPSREL